MDKACSVFSKGFAIAAILCVGGCSGDDNFQGSSVMEVHFIHYKDASRPCHELEAKSIATDSEPIHACGGVWGSDCYVYTDKAAKLDTFGELVRNCFETRRAEFVVRTNARGLAVVTHEPDLGLLPASSRARSAWGGALFLNRNGVR
jgi:hypothetical protein